MDGFETLSPLARDAAGILFIEDFDLADVADPVAPVEPPTAPPEPEPPPPSFSEEQLATAREEAYAEGRQQGYAMAIAAHERAVAQSLDRIAAGLAEATAAAEALTEETATALSTVMLRMLAAMLPRLCATHGPREAESVLRAVLPRLAREPCITVRVSPHVSESLARTVIEADAGLAARVQLIPTDAMAPGDVRIAWENGAATRDTAGLWREIDAALGGIGLDDIGVAAADFTMQATTAPAAPDDARVSAVPTRAPAVRPTRKPRSVAKKETAHAG